MFRDEVPPRSEHNIFDQRTTPRASRNAAVATSRPLPSWLVWLKATHGVTLTDEFICDMQHIPFDTEDWIRDARSVIGASLSPSLVREILVRPNKPVGGPRTCIVSSLRSVTTHLYCLRN